jgi:hypothetical protein
MKADKFSDNRVFPLTKVSCQVFSFVSEQINFITSLWESSVQTKWISYNYFLCVCVCVCVCLFIL